ncbi:hypothetical protein LTR66_007407 [Elasticomyces elasticus]|nr:hypothetical protein LTR66_007407 [Elasticomyces elasticus]KAK4992876.1 hypothetical protein LTR50_000782 [Elasticomyces elasticus]
MNPADLTRRESVTQGTPSPAAKTLPTPSSIAQKSGRAPAAAQRVDYEPTYTALRTAIGVRWGEYQAALRTFFLGNLNRAELESCIVPILEHVSTPPDTPSAMELHNTLLVCTMINTAREPPSESVAPFVVATDKPTLGGSKLVTGHTNDKTEERLKYEVMSLQPRDRRRIKSIKDEPAVVKTTPGIVESMEYKDALNARAPDFTGTSNAGGLGRTNFDADVRRRYALPLQSEKRDIYTATELQAMIEPIAFEVGCVAGTNASMAACAEMLQTALETHVKEGMEQWVRRTQSNVPSGVATSAFKKALRKEEDAVERGIIVRNVAGLLPCEVDAASKRRPITMSDLRLNLWLGDHHLTQNMFTERRVWNEEVADAEQLLNSDNQGKVNGVLETLNLDSDTNLEDSQAPAKTRKALFDVLDEVTASHG